MHDWTFGKERSPLRSVPGRNGAFWLQVFRPLCCTLNKAELLPCSASAQRGLVGVLLRSFRRRGVLSQRRLISLGPVHLTSQELPYRAAPVSPSAHRKRYPFLDGGVFPQFRSDPRAPLQVGWHA